MAKGLKIPKRVAGVKLPKKVRKRAKKAIRMGASPVVREIAAAAIGAAAGKGSERIRHAASGHVRTRIHVDGGEVGEAFRTAAIDGLRRFLEGFEEGLRAMKDREEGEKAPPTGRRKA